MAEKSAPSLSADAQRSDAAQLLATRRAIVACSLGQIFEIFDFVIYAYFASAIGKAIVKHGELIDASTLESALSISPAKSAYPGVSNRFTLTPFTVKGARLVEMVSWRATSSGSKSITVVPFSTDPRRAMAPVTASSASARVVFPAP